MRKLSFFFLLGLIMLMAAPVYAQGAAAEAPVNWGIPIGAGIGMAIASGLCGLGQGKATAHAAEAIARNPGATAAIRFALILGLVLIESLALYTLAIIIIKVK